MLKKEGVLVDISALEKAYLPMSESMFYILLSLHEPRHGYGITKYTSELTEGRVKISCATMYNTLAKLQKSGVICVYDDSDNRITYELTSRGRALLKSEIARLRKQSSDAEMVSSLI
jgi:DNA-binding PadR family transcriptional regulator